MSKSLNYINNTLQKKISKNIDCREWHSSIILEGMVATWDDVIKAGKFSAKHGYKGVVNRLEVSHLLLPKVKEPLIKDNYLEGKKVDVLIIGGGIIGASIARELSKWNISILLLEKEEDLAMQTSSRNDGMIHPGIEPKPGSKRSKFNVKGNAMYTKMAEELNVPINRLGSNILFDKKWVKFLSPIILSRAKNVGVPGVRFLSKAEVMYLEKNITNNIEGAVHFNSTAVTSPYKMTLAYAENAVMNGAEVCLNTIVKAMHKENQHIVKVITNRGIVYPKIVINAAGVFSDSVANMAGDQFFTIHPRKGEIVFLDKKKGHLINSVIAMPTLSLAKTDTKGGGIVKTIDGNILLGPDAYEQPYKEDFSTNKRNIDNILKKFLPLVNGLSFSDVITYCSGTRAATYEEDFIIEKSEYVKNLIHAAGIQSPGFASAPAIAEEIENLACESLSQTMEVKPKEHWNPIRKSIPDLSSMSFEERSKIIKNNPSFGEIICRCEEISKGEIIAAINSPIPATTVDGIKRRVRAGMGRCQGGFCLPLVMNIIHEESGKEMTKITKLGGKSNILIKETKADEAYLKE